MSHKEKEAKGSHSHHHKELALAHFLFSDEDVGGFARELVL